MLDNFVNKYDSVAVCGCWRFGTTAVSSKITEHLRKNGHATEELDEFFAGHQYYTRDSVGHLKTNFMPDNYLMLGSGDGLDILVSRPIAPGLFLSKMAWLNRQVLTTKVVFKIDPPDWNGQYAASMEKSILENRRVYKIGVNRKDVGNALISCLIGKFFNFWNHDRETLNVEYNKPVIPVTVEMKHVYEIFDAMITHNHWLWCEKERIDKLVWYDEIENLRIPEMGLVDDIECWSAKHRSLHYDRAKKYFINYEDVIHMANTVQHNLDGLIESVRLRYI